LPAHVGIAVARDLLFTGRNFDATEALRIGLLSRVVPHDDLPSAAVEAAQQVLRTAPTARAQVKRMLNERYGHVDYHTMFWAIENSSELRDGMRAFMEKRPPPWIPDGVPLQERI
jgi:enoyl-CoA hydratase